MGILGRIIERRKERISEAKSRVSLSDIRRRAGEMQSAPRSLARSLERPDGRIALIAELKKASPSKGLIREDFDPRKIAGIYADKGANAVSVLTEEDFFQGDIAFVEQVREVFPGPALRKDFIVDEYQVWESRAGGADALLLIAAALSEGQAAEYLAMASELGLGVLFEVHDLRELETALRVGAPIIGINNRNLDTLEIDLDTTFKLKAEIPKDRLVVSESGIESRSDVERLEGAGVNAMLVGTSIMASEDMGATLDHLLGRG